MILVIDNQGSFTHNLVQLLGRQEVRVEVRRNDEITVAEMASMRPSHVVISPGPKRPEDAGASLEIIRGIAGRVPVLGVSLGHLAIAAAFGARIGPAGSIVHGKTSSIRHDGRTIFQGLDSPAIGTRYHSLSVDRDGFPHRQLEITAESEDGEIMGIRHRFLAAVEGVQFHPESILTECGQALLQNFLRLRAGGEIIR